MNRKIMNIGLTGILALGLTGCVDAEKYTNCIKKNITLELQDIGPYNQGNRIQRYIFEDIQKEVGKEISNHLGITEKRVGELVDINDKNASNLYKKKVIITEGIAECRSYFDKKNIGNSNLNNRISNMLKLNEQKINFNNSIGSYLNNY